MRIVVTGATGQVAYALLPRIAAGEMFGADTEVDLRLADIPQVIEKAKGTLMELEDGSAIRDHAAAGARVAVVGNPCNTNCLIARHAAGAKVPDDRWSAMTRLDHNRARALLAKQAKARVNDVRKLAIWGNHSATLYPDFTNAEVNGRPAASVVERRWLESEFITLVQQRGAAVIAARGASSALSAAQALIDHVRSLVTPTPKGDCFSAAVVSDGSYGVSKGLVSSFPLHSRGDGGWEIVKRVTLDDFARSKIAATVAELEKERDIVKDLLAAA